MTRKETALDALNKKIPKLEEKINQDKQLLEELKAKREMLEVEALKKFWHDHGGDYCEADCFFFRGA